jgi:hypothetical protein
MAMDGIGLSITSIGAILVYSGIKGYSVLDVLRNVVTGKPIAENVNLKSVGNANQIDPEYQPYQRDGSGSDPSTLSGNKALGNDLAKSYGWSTGLEWQALEELWTRESAWNNKAINYTSGAYGIPQALPPTKMPREAQAPPIGTSDARAQIVWGLNYISSRYQSPIFALAHHKTYSWY